VFPQCKKSTAKKTAQKKKKAQKNVFPLCFFSLLFLQGVPTLKLSRYSISKLQEIIYFHQISMILWIKPSQITNNKVSVIWNEKTKLLLKKIKSWRLQGL
jgi:hypothetical protein